MNNYATGIAVFQGDLYLAMINTQFHSNKADFILSVSYYEKLFINTSQTFTLNIFKQYWRPTYVTDRKLYVS